MPGPSRRLSKIIGDANEALENLFDDVVDLMYTETRASGSDGGSPTSTRDAAFSSLVKENDEASFERFEEKLRQTLAKHRERLNLEIDSEEPLEKEKVKSFMQRAREKMSKGTVKYVSVGP